jgi:small subunit ribosomal protein S14
MTASDWKKVMKQIEKKPAKLNRFMKYNKPKARKFGRSTKACEMCGRIGAHVGNYGINMCRQCFRQQATKLGFKKYY